MGNGTRVVWGLVCALIVLTGCQMVIHPEGEAEQRERFLAAGVSGARVCDLEQRSSLPDVLDYAQKRNGTLQAAYLDWQASLERVPQAGALEDPTLMLGYEFALDPLNRRTMPPAMKKWTVDRILTGYVQMIPHPSKRSTRAEKALIEAVGAAEKYRSAYYDLRNRTAAAYAEALYVQQTLSLEEENTRLLKEIYDLAGHQLHAGEMQQAELAKLDVEILRAESVQKAAEIERGRRIAELNALLNREPGATFAGFDSTGLKLRSQSLPKLLKLACANPELEALRRDVDARGADVVLANLQRLPDFEINLPQVQTLTQMMMMGVTLPINRERIDAGVREMTASRDAAAARLKSQESAVKARTVVALAMLSDARRILDDFEGRIAGKTKDVLKIQQEYYGAGTGDVLSILDTQRTLLDLRRIINRAHADEIRAMGELEAVAGASLLTVAKPAPAAKSAPVTEPTPKADTPKTVVSDTSSTSSVSDLDSLLIP